MDWEAGRTMRQQALNYAKRGWLVFPCHHIKDGRCSCGDTACSRPGKHPRTQHGLKDATGDAAKVTSWWNRWPDANIGIYAHGSGLAVVDVDPAHGGSDSWRILMDTLGADIADTFCVRTGGGGWHYYYLEPDGGILNNRSDWMPGIDTRTEGYVIAPPSNHVSGGTYSVEDDRPIAPMPPALVHWFRTYKKAAPERQRPVDPHPVLDARAESYAQSALDREVRELSQACPGGQNDALNRAAFSLGQLVAGGLLSRIEVEIALERTMLSLPFDPAQGPWTPENMAATMRSGLESGMAHPRGLPPETPMRPASNSAAKRKPVAKESTQPAAPAAKQDTGKSSKHINQVAERWADAVRDSYLYTSNDQWWQYQSGRWRMVDDPFVHRAIREFALPIYGDKLKPVDIDNLARMARLLLLRDVRDMGGRPTVIPFRNGVYDRVSEEFLRHSPEHLLTRQLDYDYDRAADCPKFRAFLSQVLLSEDGKPCEEWIDIVQEWLGYLLCPDASAQTAMVLLGSGSNGKGVLTKVMEAFVGRDQSTAVAIDQLHDAYHRADLYGKMLGITGDLDKTAMRRSAGWFKAIVGGDEISARHPTQRVFHFTSTMRIVISCNDLPDTSDVSWGYFRRLLILDFRKQVSERERVSDLAEQLTAELPGIFNWALAGLRRFERNGRRFTESAESRCVLNEYRYEMDPVARFVDEECTRGKEDWCWVDELYKAFAAWCFRKGIKPVINELAFGHGLSRINVAKPYAARDGNGVVRKARKEIAIRDREPQ